MSWLLYTLLHNHTQNDAVQVKEDLKVNDCIIHIVEHTLGPPPGPPSCQSSLCTVELINCSAQSWTQVPEKQANRRKHEAFTHTPKVLLPTSPFLRPGISGHTQILQTPLEEARKKCETVFTNLLSFPYRIEERSFSFSASLVHCSYAVRRLKMTEKTKI